MGLILFYMTLESKKVQVYTTQWSEQKIKLFVGNLSIHLKLSTATGGKLEKQKAPDEETGGIEQ